MAKLLENITRGEKLAVCRNNLIYLFWDLYLDIKNAYFTYGICFCKIIPFVLQILLLRANLVTHCCPHAPVNLTCLLWAAECGRRYAKAVFVISPTPVALVFGGHQASCTHKVTIRYKICFGTSRSKVCQSLNSQYDSRLPRVTHPGGVSPDTEIFIFCDPPNTKIKRNL